MTILQGYCDKFQGTIPVVYDNGVTDEALIVEATSASNQFLNLGEPKINLEACILGSNR